MVYAIKNTSFKNYLLLLYCIILCCIVYACKPAVKNIHQSGEVPALRMIEQDTLLNLVKHLAENMAAKHNDVAEANKLIKRYTAQYKINAEATGEPVNKAADYLSIEFAKAERDTSKILFCALVLPKPLCKTLAFKILKAHFGDWKTLPPSAGGPIISLFKKAPAPGISIAVDSKNLPKYPDNSIEEIRISSPIL